MPFSRTTDRSTFTNDGESPAVEETLRHYVRKLLSAARNDFGKDEEGKRDIQSRQGSRMATILEMRRG